MLKSGLHTDADYGTRRKRRNAVKVIVTCLTAIREAEQTYLEKVPGNLLNSESVDVGEYAVDVLDDIIDLLVEVY